MRFSAEVLKFTKKIEIFGIFCKINYEIFGIFLYLCVEGNT